MLDRSLTSVFCTECRLQFVIYKSQTDLQRRTIRAQFSLMVKPS